MERRTRTELLLQEGSSLLADPVASYMTQDPWAADARVIPIDPALAAGADFCLSYDIPPSNGFNCVVVCGSRGDNETIAACLAPVGARLDLNGAIRKALGARSVRMLDRERATTESQMEEGAITPIGLPRGWRVLLPPSLKDLDYMVVGGGRKTSKLRVNPSTIAHLPNSSVVQGLVKSD